MSSNIYWRPDELDKAREDLGRKDDSLKLTLRDEFGYPLDEVFGEDSIPMFRGLAMAGIPDAQKVIEHIKKYGRIRIFEQ